MNKQKAVFRLTTRKLALRP